MVWKRWRRGGREGGGGGVREGWVRKRWVRKRRWLGRDG